MSSDLALPGASEVAPLIHPYLALCADVGPPTEADWAHYVLGERQPHVC